MSDKDALGLVERLRTWAEDDVLETARDGTFEYADGERWASMMREAADALTSQAEEIERLLSGEGFVYLNPDTGEEYSPNHPVESGEVSDAEDVRRSTGQEDHLASLVQSQETEIERLREALKPFAGAAGRWDDIAGVYHCDDNVPIERHPMRLEGVTVGDLRRARLALNGDQP